MITTYKLRVIYLFCGIMFAAFCSHLVVQNAVAEPRSSAVNLEITTHLGDQQIFAEHDVISFFISLDHAAYLYAFYQDAAGDVYQVLPSPALTDHYFLPGFYIPFPPANSAFRFVVQPPFGEEQLWLFASNNNSLTFSDSTATAGFKKIQQTRQQLRSHIQAASQQVYAESALQIHTRRQ